MICLVGYMYMFIMTCEKWILDNKWCWIERALGTTWYFVFLRHPKNIIGIGPFGSIIKYISLSLPLPGLKINYYQFWKCSFHECDTQKQILYTRIFLSGNYKKWLFFIYLFIYLLLLLLLFEIVAYLKILILKKIFSLPRFEIYLILDVTLFFFFVKYHL